MKFNMNLTTNPKFKPKFPKTIVEWDIWTIDNDKSLHLKSGKLRGIFYES